MPQELLAKLRIDRSEEGPDFGRYTLEPLPVGFGQTLGNSLRRVLYSSLPGAAVTFAKIEGVPHQFSTVPGTKEDVIDLVQNFKRIRIKIHNNQPVILKLETTGPGKVYAKDFELIGSGEIVNQNLEIATLADRKSKLSIELTAEPGFGYVPSEERPTAKIGVIPVDSIFTPVSHVSYKVEQTRLGHQTNLEKLVIEIKTDGTITPDEALKSSARVLIDYFQTVENGGSVTPDAEKGRVEEKSRKSGTVDLNVPVEDLGLSTRTTNALVKSKVKTLGDLAEKKAEDLAKTRGLGEKGIGEIEDLLKKHDL